MFLPKLDTDYLVNFLVDLLETPSPTGYTEAAIALVEKELSAYPQLSLSRTRKGALVARWEGTRQDAPRALTAHVDTLGAMVKEIKPNGRLSITRVGGLLLNAVETEGCWVHTSKGEKVRGSLLCTLASAHVHSGAAIADLKRDEDSMEIRLAARFGEDAVFMDVDDIPAGLDFVEVLQNAVQSCDALAALIGRDWLDARDEAGGRRLDNPEDFVRVEIAAALERGIRVIPVLVDGAPIPRASDLPENLKPLARRNAVQVNHPSFNADAYHLIEQLELALKAVEDSKLLKARVLQEEQERKRVKSREQAERERKIRYESPSPGGRGVRGAALSLSKGEGKGKPAWLPFGVGGFVFIVLIGLFLGGSYIIRTLMETIEPTQTIPVSDALPTPVIFLKSPTSTHETNVLPTPISAVEPSTLGVGSTMISEKDGMVMVYVPAGEFQMGSEDGSDDEKPVHTVYLDAFWIDQTEITNAMYAKCVDAGECGRPDLESFTRNTYYGNPEFYDYPVIHIYWSEAVWYCEWAGRRLPTEAEWEKAASWDEKNQTKHVYPWGDSIGCSQANYWGKDGGCVGDTTAVGHYENGQSPYGAYDMAGNVWEWVSSLYQPYPYNASDGRENMSNLVTLSATGNRVLRGGAWNYSDYYLRSAGRQGGGPADTRVDIGFRCAHDAE